MSLSSVGDLRQHFVTSRNIADLKTDLGTLVEELTTGEVSDLTAHLGAGQTQLVGIDRQLAMLAQFSQSNVETGQILSTMQLALANIEDHRASSSSSLLTINSTSSTSQIEIAALAARAGFESTIQSLNLRSNDRSMFGGNDLDSNPLASADEIFTALTLATSGLTEAEDISAAIDDWFTSPGGGFDTVGYQGDSNGFLERPLSTGQSVEIGIRANDDALRDTLKAFAIAAIAGDVDSELAIETRRTLQVKSGEDLLSVASPLAGLQGRLGYIESQVEEASTRNASLETSFGIARNTLVSADPFETATRLQEVQLQLETQYSLTARLSRLSLTEYLR
ncbi:flagellin [Octadecabacter sp.]|nr:flagellin [Octadecabacter sp.]